MDDGNEQLYRGTLYPVLLSAETTNNSLPCQNGNQAPSPALFQTPRAKNDRTELVGLMDHRTKYKGQLQQQQRSKSCSFLGLWILFKMFFIATTAFLAAALIWRNFNYGTNTHEQTRGFSYFTQFFRYLRTPEEQVAFARATYQIEEEESVKTNKTITQSITCHFHCHDNQTLQLPTSPIPPCLKAFLPIEIPKFRNAAPATTVGLIHYHGCCQSQTYFQSPPTAEGIDGQVKTLATYGNRSQYFKTQDCIQVSGCTGCTCTSIMEVFTALVINQYGVLQLSDIKLRGCCKCLNKDVENV